MSFTSEILSPFLMLIEATEDKLITDFYSISIHWWKVVR